MTSARQAALVVLWSRVTQIRTANGYQTEAGAKVFIGESPVLGEDDPLASVAIVVREDTLGHQGENVDVTLPVDVQAIVRADAVDPSATTEAVIADIKRAVEQDHTMGGTLKQRGLERGPTRPLPREDGSQFVGASVEYRLRFLEKWGDP